MNGVLFHYVLRCRILEHSNLVHGLLMGVKSPGRRGVHDEMLPVLLVLGSAETSHDGRPLVG